MKRAILALFCFFQTFPAWGTSLSSDLRSLAIPSDAVTASPSYERVYTIQSRSQTLSNRFEISAGGAKNFNPSSFLLSQEVNLQANYYFSDRFYAAVYGAYVFNSLSGAGQELWNQNHIFPDISCVKFRSDASLNYNLFYGKFRLTMDSVFYFDQYVALGAGVVGLTDGIQDVTRAAAVADVGVSFWFGRNWSARVGLKDYYFEEVRRLGTGYVNHLLGHISLGYVFGGGGNV